jgi:hypothetical protein
VAWTLAAVSLPATPLLAQEPAAVAGVVVDAESNAPIPGVEIRILGSNLVALSGDDGSFLLAEIPRGSQRLVLRHIAYGEHERTLTLDEPGTLRFLIRMSREAIELEPLVVDVAGAYADEVFRGGGNPANIIGAETIEAADRTGMTLMSLLRQVPGVRVRGDDCLEYRLQGGGSAIGVRAPDLPPDTRNPTCREMAVFIDGVRVQESTDLLLDTYLSQLERIEVLSPGQAGVRYGVAGARGVLLLETKQGVAPELVPDRAKYTGFGWHDTRPYRWARVLGISLGTHAAAAAFTFGTVIDCDQYVALDAPTTCTSALAVGLGLMAGTVSGLLTGWAGKGEVTEGRTFPLLAVSAASATTSYLLIKNAEEADSGLAGVTGMALAAVGASILTTLTDRIFRVAR